MIGIYERPISIGTPMFSNAQFRQCSSPFDGFTPLTVHFLRDLYLASKPDPKKRFEAAIAEAASTGPWAASYEVAPAETVQAVEQALVALMQSTATLRVEAVDPSRLDPASRVHRHLTALVDLWRSLGDLLPADLTVLRHVIESRAEDAVERIELIVDPDEPSLCAAGRTVLDTLHRHHGRPADIDARIAAMREEARTCRAEAETLLGHLQRSLLSPNAGQCAADATLRVFGVRDAALEAEVAAGMAQSWLNASSGLAPADIGILIADADLYGPFLREAFAISGLPLSGLPAQRDARDLGAEAVLHFLLCRRPPAPAMALTSLYSSPLMPWPPETGQALASAIMGGDYEPRLARDFDGAARRMYEVIRRRETPAPRALADELAVFAGPLKQNEAHGSAVAAALDRIDRLRSLLLSDPQAAEPPWEDLVRLATPGAPFATGSTVRTTGGITVFMADQPPWRPVRHLIVLGFAEGSYPASPAGNPVFLDSEIDEIERACGLRLVSGADMLNERLHLFERQIASASDSLTLFTPFRNLAGNRTAPSATLALIARCIDGVSEPQKLVTDLARVDDVEWPREIPRAPRTKNQPLPPLSSPRTLSLGRDLLSIRVGDDGVARPQSPSRLETLIARPLDWLLNELGATDIVWTPERADVLIKGSLAHQVFERLFVPGDPVPDTAAIQKAVPILLNAAIQQIAPFMQGSAWSVERRTLEREIVNAAISWREALVAHGAEIIANEFRLAGTIFGVPIHGKADCLLRLRDGDLVIVDHKKSGSKTRRARLEAGWDLQVDLYRTMAREPVAEDETNEARKALSAANRIGVAYHLMNDGAILLDGIPLTAPSQHVTKTSGDISSEAMKKLREEVSRLRKGNIQLNEVGDRAFFSNTAHMGEYAFDTSPLIDAFSVSVKAGDEADHA